MSKTEKPVHAESVLQFIRENTHVSRYEIAVRLQMPLEDVAECIRWLEVENFIYYEPMWQAI